MAEVKQKTPAKSKSEAKQASRGVGNFMKVTYRATMDASQEMMRITLDIPINIMEGVGVSRERTDALKQRSHQFVDDFYGGMDKVASSVGSAVGAPARAIGSLTSRLRQGKGPKAAAEKSAKAVKAAKATKESKAEKAPKVEKALKAAKEAKKAKAGKEKKSAKKATPKVVAEKAAAEAKEALEKAA